MPHRYCLTIAAVFAGLFLSACSDEPPNDTVAGQLPPCESKYIKWMVKRLIENSERGVQFGYKVSGFEDQGGGVRVRHGDVEWVRECHAFVDTNRGRFRVIYSISLEQNRERYTVNADMYAF